MTRRLDYNQVAPNGAKALGGVYGYVLQSGLPGELVDLVYLRVSQINTVSTCTCANFLSGATANDLRRFQIEQQEDGVPLPTMKSIVSALRFFLTHTVDRPDLARKLVRLAHPRTFLA